VLSAIEGGQSESNWSSDIIEWLKLKQKLVIKDDVLFLSEEDGLKVVVPSKLVKLVLVFHHDSRWAGHRDADRTYNTIKSGYFCLKMRKAIKEYCETCHLCQTKKYISRPLKAPLKPIEVKEPWALIGIDVTGPLRVTPNGHQYIIVAVDYFSKFCIAKAIPSFSAEITARFLFEDVVCKFGLPKSIISDNGVNFNSRLFTQLCALCGIEKANSSFYHPPGNGLVERMNKTMKQILTMYVNDSHSNWDAFLQASISAYNSCIHSSTGFSPYEVLFARKPRRVVDVILDSRVELNGAGIDQYVRNLHVHAGKVVNRVNEQLDKARAKQKNYYDKFINSSKVFKEGDFVLIATNKQQVGQSKSFINHATGPHVIVKTFNDVNYVIKDLSSGRVQTIHYNRLKPYKYRPGECITGSAGEHPGKSELISSVSNSSSHEFVIFIPIRPGSAIDKSPTEELSEEVSSEAEIVNEHDDDSMPPLEDPLEGSMHEAYGDAEEPASSPEEQVQATQPTSSLAAQVDDLAALGFDSQLDGLGGLDGSEENDEADGKEECPICKKKFISVNIHFGRMHKDMLKQAKT
jgi:hypothetical protein